LGAHSHPAPQPATGCYTSDPGRLPGTAPLWRPGDLLDLDLAMPPQLVEANPLVEETRNQLAVKRGPLGLLP